MRCSRPDWFWWLCVLTVAACGGEPQPPKRLDWGPGSTTAPLPPTQTRTWDGPARDLPVADGGAGAEAGAIACLDESPCRGYACDATKGACRTACTAPAQCAMGYVCDDSTTICLPAVPCQGDGDCSGYLCDLVAGVCEVSCAFTLLCAPGYLCGPDGRCS